MMVSPIEEPQALFRLGGYPFTELGRVPDAPDRDGCLEDTSGIYVILRPSEPDSGENPILYIGQAGSLLDRVHKGHEKAACWKRHSAEFCRAFHRTPEKSKAEREVIESELIELYKPPCNDRLSFDLKSRVE